MSTTAVEVKGPNKALFRTAALAGSAIIWGSLGYLALTYVPKYEKPIVDIETIIDGIRAQPIIDPPRPPPLPPQVRPDRPVIRTQDPVAAINPLTTRPTTNTRPNPLAGDLPAGPISDGPVAFGGSDTPILSELSEPTVLATLPNLPEIIETPPPPMPKLVINPVKISGANPNFPNRALDRGVSGEVTLSFTVSTTGKVENIDITGEEPRNYGFGRAAREAIQGWTFQPQTIDGVAVAYPARYTISFKLED